MCDENVIDLHDIPKVLTHIKQYAACSLTKHLFFQVGSSVSQICKT
jgi:hypothetical protein